MRKFLTGFIVATTILTGSVASAKDFSDTKGHWAEEKINYYSSIGLVSGYGDGTFRPNAQVTKAEACIVYCNVTGKISNRGILIPYYLEFLAGRWYGDGMFYGLENGMVEAENFIDFNQGRVMTRGDIAKTVSGFLTINELTVDDVGCRINTDISDNMTTKYLTGQFKDLIGDEKHIADALNWNIFKGYEDGTFRPDAPVSRAEMLYVAERLKELDKYTK